jgi:hypothetical protein
VDMFAANEQGVSMMVGPNACVASSVIGIVG